MAIKFNCPHCKKVLSVKDDSLAGKKAACTGCKKIVVIPKPAPAPAAAPAEDVEALAAAALSEPKPDPATAQESATFQFECPQCGEQVTMSRELAGKNAQCPECRRVIRVPQPKTKDPADWRNKGDTLPTGARRDTEPAPEGAWESSRAKGVSIEALTQAGLVKKKKKPGLTRKQKVYRGLAVGAAVLVVAVGGLFAWSSLAHEKEEKLVDNAVKKAEEQEGKSKELAAEANRAAGEYFLRTATRDVADKAQKRYFARARTLLETAEGPGRDALAIDLLLSQADLGGGGDEVKRGQRLKWETVLVDLKNTLHQVASSSGRLQGLRLVSRRLIERGSPETAVALARSLVNKKPGEGDDESLAYEGHEALAVLGIEFFRARQADKAAPLAADLSRLYEQPDAAANPRPPVAPSAVALCVALGKPEPKPGKAKNDEALCQLGRLAGLALKGEAAAARDVPANAAPEWRFQMQVAVADVTGEAADVEAAAATLDGDLGAKPVSPWLVYRLAQLAAAAGQADRALHVAERVSDPGLKARAQLEAVRARLQATKGRAGDGVLDGVEKGPLAQGLAREALARHNARHDGSAGALKEAEGWDEVMRPLGLLGAVLGGQDAAGK